MSEIKDQNYSPKYDEEEKDFHVAQGIWKNNHVIFKMIEDDIDSLITRRLLSLMNGYPKVFQKQKETIVHCKE